MFPYKFNPLFLIIPNRHPLVRQSIPNHYPLDLNYMFRTDRIDELSEQSSPSCTKNLMKDFEDGTKKKTNDFMEELERNLEFIDNRDINGLESKREGRKTAGKHSRVLVTAEDQYVVKDEETRIFMEAVYPDYQDAKREIPLKEFIGKAVVYFFPQSNPPTAVLSSLRKHTQPLLTTTSPTLLSINALSIVTKSTPLRLLLQQHLLSSQYSYLNKKMQQEHQKIFLEFTKLEKEIKNQKEANGKRGKELKEKEGAIREKDKEVNSREKEMKERLQKEYEKRVEMFGKFVEEAIGQLDKKAAAIERNIKYKIHILDNRLEQLNKAKDHKLTVDTKQRQRIIRLEKENEQLRSRCKEIDQITTDYLKQKEGLVKKIIVFEEKINKFQKKNGNLKEELIGKEQLTKVLSGKNQQLKRQIQALKQFNKGASKKETDEFKIQKTDKTPRATDLKFNSKCFVRLLNSLLQTAESSIPKIIKFYREESTRPLDFELVQVFYPRQKELSEHFLSLLVEIFNTQKSADKMYLINESLPTIEFIIKMVLFSFNLNYSKDKNDNILTNPIKSTAHILFASFASNQLCQKCLKIIKKIQKGLSKPDLCLTFSVLAFLLAITQQNLLSSLTVLTTLLNTSTLQSFLNYDVVTYLLLKTISTPILSSLTIDILLECCSNQNLSRTLSLLQQSQTYLILLRLLQSPLEPSQIQKLSIILQRYSYVYKKQMVIERDVLKIIKQLIDKYDGDKQRLIAANFKSILTSST